jgi:hypothetical protein
VPHKFGLSLPVVLVILYDTERINPEAFQSQTTGNMDSILKGFWESCYLEAALKIIDVGFVSTEFGVQLR